MYWQRIPDIQSEKTLWKDIDDSKVSLDEDEICELFAQAEPQKPAVVVSAAPQAPKLVEILDQNRAKSISIMASRFRKPADEIASGIKNLSDTIKEEEAQALKTNEPTPDEIASVSAYDGDLSLLGKAEVFVKALGEVKLLSQHLDFLLLRATFENQMQEIESPINILISGFKSLKESACLKEALTLVLRLGNYINGGTTRGGAYGFKLEFLSKIDNVRTSKQGYTLANYLADKLDVAKLKLELESVKKSLTVDFDTIKGSYSKIKGTIRKLDNVMPAAEKLVLDGYVLFPSYMNFMSEETKDRVAKPEADFEEAAALFKELAESYGEDPSAVPMAEFLGMFSEFVDTLVKANLANEKAKEEERKAALRAKQPQPVPGARPMPGMAPRMGSGDAQRGVLDELMKILANGPARLRRLSKKGSAPDLSEKTE